jgi:Mn2+/Fe2+ NRAMP family transporter
MLTLILIAIGCIIFIGLSIAYVLSIVTTILLLAIPATMLFALAIAIDKELFNEFKTRLSNG